MTDNDIIKANKIIDDLYKYCYYSQLKSEKPCGITDNDFDFLHNFINSQKAEIEKLKEELQKQKMILEDIDNAIYPLPIETDFDKTIKHAKSEAIKEFAERLKDIVFSKYEFTDIRVFTELDNLVKEMTYRSEEE